MKTWQAAAVAVWVAASVQAGLVDFNGTPVDVEYWAGLGQNSSIMVVDFGSQSYAFGYRWDDVAAPSAALGSAPNGFQMLTSVADAGGLDMTYTYFAGFGNSVSTISYDGHTMGAVGWPTDWLSYWTSTDGKTWADSSVGAEGRSLANGDWDGWSVETSSVWPPENTPTTPTPEPGTLALLALGGGVFAARRLATRSARR